jgi:two-component system, LytTR family, sensor histidine kinase AlgZ
VTRGVLTPAVRTLGFALALGAVVGTVLASDAGGLHAAALARSIFIATLFSASITGLAVVAFLCLAPRLRGLAPLAGWTARAAVLLGAATAGTLLAELMLLALGLRAPGRFWDGFGQALRVAVLIAVVAGAGAVGYERLRAQLAASEALAAEARLASLESRLRPHFLFNALNAVLALIPEDPGRAERVLERLSGILRCSLDAANLLSVGEELRMVRDYLEIEAARFGGRLRFHIEVPEELEALEVPSFAVQTLVENSVKHVLGARRGGCDIAIRAGRDRDRLTIEVHDDGPGFEAADIAPGRGLATLRARLAALYGAGADLEVGPGPGGRVTVRVPARRAAAAAA